MELVKHETCQEYFDRRISEGWKCISLEGYNAVLLSPDGIRREIDLRNDVETLRPNAAGDLCQWDSETGAACPNHYQNVDEVSNDFWVTYVRDAVSGHVDLYNIQNYSVGSGTINKVTVYWSMASFSGDLGDGYYGIKSGGTEYWEAKIDPFPNGGSFTQYSTEYTTDPKTASPWAWDALDALQVGIKTGTSGYDIVCTQIYVEVDYTPPPDPPTNLAATDGSETSKAVITWTKSSGATNYEVFRDGVGLGEIGDVATYDDSGADAGVITPGTPSATDGSQTAYVTLSLAGESVANGTTHTYKVRAKNAGGWSGDSNTNTGYRGVGSITYQWQRSAADSDASYSNIGGGTTDPYNDTGAPANGDGRYFRCVLSATGTSNQTSTADRGYRDVLAASGGSPLAQMIQAGLI